MLIGKYGRVITHKKLGSCHGNMVKIRKKTWHTIKNIMREVECESCGCKLKKCNWLRHLVAKTHTDGVENGGVGEIQVAGG